MSHTDLLRQLLTNIVFVEDSIEINATTDEKGTLFRIKVAKEDMPILIGKEGNNLKAIKRILVLLGSKQNQKFSLIVND